MSEKEPKKSKMGLKVVSVILAILLWMYVGNQGGQGATKNTVEAPLEYRNVEQNLTVQGPETVSVKLWGAYGDSSNIVAYVDLAGYEKGNHMVPVHVEPVKGAMFTSVQPDKVKVRLDSVKERVLPVKQEIKQNPPAGYKLIELRTSPDKCIIKGDRDLVARVATVAVPVDLGEARDIVSMKAALQARDIDGKLIGEGLQIIPGTVDVYAVLEQEIATRKVSVKAQVTGNPAPGFTVGKVTAEPQEITVLGSAALLEDVKEISTQAVNIEGANADIVQVVNLNFPPGIAGNPSRVSVQIKLDHINKEGQE